MCTLMGVAHSKAVPIVPRVHGAPCPAPLWLPATVLKRQACCRHIRRHAVSGQPRLHAHGVPCMKQRLQSCEGSLPQQSPCELFSWRGVCSTCRASWILLATCWRRESTASKPHSSRCRPHLCCSLCPIWCTLDPPAASNICLVGFEQLATCNTATTTQNLPGC